MKFETLIALGGALIDLIVPCSVSELSGYGATLGQSRLLNQSEYAQMIQHVDSRKMVPGGSVSNTARVFSQVGGKSIFVSSVGKDVGGRIIQEALQKDGVTPLLEVSPQEKTGAVMVFVPKGHSDRAMCAYHGANGISFQTIQKIPFSSKSMLVLEGYWMIKHEPSLLQASIMAKTKKAFVVLMGSDPSCLKANREGFLKLLKGPVDMLILNAAEAQILTQKDLTSSIKWFQSLKKKVVITLAERGSLWIEGKNIFYCQARQIKVRDATGAGDVFAGGLLFGISQGFSPSTCLKIGNYLAGEVVQVLGARLEKNVRTLLKRRKYRFLITQRLKQIPTIETSRTL